MSNKIKATVAFVLSAVAFFMLSKEYRHYSKIKSCEDKVLSILSARNGGPPPADIREYVLRQIKDYCVANGGNL